jgi:hypothetical protein
MDAFDRQSGIPRSADCDLGVSEAQLRLARTVSDRERFDFSQRPRKFVPDEE